MQADPETGLLIGHDEENFLAYEIAEDFSNCLKREDLDYVRMVQTFPDNNTYIDRLSFRNQPLPYILESLFFNHDLIIRFLYKCLNQCNLARDGYVYHKLRFSLIYQLPESALPLLINSPSLEDEHKSILKWRLSTIK